MFKSIFCLKDGLSWHKRVDRWKGAEQSGRTMKSHKPITDSRASRRQIPESTWSRCRTRCRAARGACCTSPARCAPGDDPTPPGHPESWLVRSERGCRVPETWYSIGISTSKFVSRTIRFISIINIIYIYGYNGRFGKFFIIDLYVSMIE